MVIGIARHNRLPVLGALLFGQAVIFVIGIGDGLGCYAICSDGFGGTIAKGCVSVGSRRIALGFREKPSHAVVGVCGGLLALLHRLFVPVSKVGCGVVFYDRAVLGVGLSGDMLLFVTESNTSDCVKTHCKLHLNMV